VKIIKLGLKGQSLTRKRSRSVRKNKKIRMNRIQTNARSILKSMRLRVKVLTRMILAAITLRTGKRETRRK